MRPRPKPALLIPLLIYGALTLLWYWRLWTPIEGAAATFKYDPVHEYWADLIYQIDTLKDGVLAVWNPHDRGGFPVYGDPQPGLLYPGNWPLWAVGAVTDTPYWLMELKVLGHWVFGLMGMHLFLRRRRLPEAACFLGAILFGFTEPAIRYGGNALNWSYAWLPWLLIAIDGFCDERTRQRAVLLGSALAMTLLAGAPAVFLYGIIAGLPYGLYRMRGRWRGATVPAAVAALTFVAWTLPLLLGNAEQVPHSIRDVRNLEFITFSTFAPTQLSWVVIPRLGLYYGALMLVFAGVWAATTRGLALVVVGTFALGIALSLGHHAEFLGAGASVLPPLGLFRRAHRYLYVASFALSIAAAFGFAAVLRAEGERARRLLRRGLIALVGVAAVLGVGLVIGLVTTDKPQTPRADAFSLAVASAVAGAFLFFCLLSTAGRARRIWAGITVVFVAGDLWLAYARIHAAGYGPKPVPERDAEVLALEGVTEGRYRIYDRGLVKFRPGVRLRIRDFGGYEDDPLGLARYREFKNAALRSPRLLGHANVRYVMNGRRPKLSLRAPWARPLGGGVYQLEQVAPRVLYLPRARQVENVGEAVRVLRSVEPGTGGVIEGVRPPMQPDAEPASGEVISHGPNHVRARIDVPAPGVVIVAESYFPAWEATVNGEPATLHPGNGMFTAVVVDEPGEAIIELELSPGRFYWTLPFPLVALCALVWALWGLRRRRGQGAAS